MDNPFSWIQEGPSRLKNVEVLLFNPENKQSRAVWDG